MYKRTSQSLQAAHAVDRPHPSRGYIDGPSTADAQLPDVGHLTLEQARAESHQLRLEITRAEQDLVIAKLARHRRRIADIGQRKAVLQARLTAVKRQIGKLDGASELHRLRVAVRELAPDIADAIFEHARQLRSAPQHIDAPAERD